jgi:hypothetical protein
MSNDMPEVPAQVGRTPDLRTACAAAHPSSVPCGSGESTMRIFVFRWMVAIAGCAIVPATAQAALFCVNSQSSIQTALNSAGTNGQDDEIDIVAGTYALTGGLAFSSGQANNITVFGGFNADCSHFTGAETILNGQGASKPLFIANFNGNIHVEGLTFVNGLSTNNRGGGLCVVSTSGDIRIDLNRFLANRADDYAGALFAYTDSGSLRIRNNLVVANSGAVIGGMELTQGSGEASVEGNTIVGNTSDTALVAVGLRIESGAHYTLSNNIIWNNGSGGDFGSGGSGHSRIANDIGLIQSGTFADLVQNEQSTDPQFAPCGGFLCLSFELERTSPLVDAGSDTPVGGTTTNDLAGKFRKIGAHVDIGAYENDLIFANGFE